WSWAETFEYDRNAAGVDRGWVRSENPQDPNNGTMNAGAGLGLSYLREIGKTYRLGGYEMGQLVNGQRSWRWLTTCVLQPGFNCMGMTVTRHIERYRYNPLATLTVDSELYEYLGPQTTGPAWNRVASYPGGAIAFHAQFADQTRSRLVVFGGSRQPASASDANIREFDPSTSTWTTYLPPVTIPPTPWPTRRFGHSIAYDERRNVAVMFGGFDLSSTTGAVRNDTWELSWDNTANTWVWNEIDFTNTPGRRPGGRMLHSMTYDPVRQRVVLTGGIAKPFLAANSGVWPFRTKPTLTTYPQAYSDVWEWDGTRWELRAPANHRIERFSAPTAWDPASEQSMTFGGISHAGILPAVITTRFEALDAYGPQELATTVNWGSSCPTPGNSVTGGSGQRPYVGTKFDVSWSLPNSGINYLPILFVGVQPLVTNLGFVGLPQCNMLIDLNFPIYLANNQTQFEVDIVDGPYGGIPIYTQVSLIDTATMNVAEVTDVLQLNLVMR
ncbi:MAG: kelch repeat-containing protein, partial [bacterium]|nr:kelch repeat-containing protein [bacterium]